MHLGCSASQALGYYIILWFYWFNVTFFNAVEKNNFIHNSPLYISFTHMIFSYLIYSTVFWKTVVLLNGLLYCHDSYINWHMPYINEVYMWLNWVVHKLLSSCRSFCPQSWSWLIICARITAHGGVNVSWIKSSLVFFPFNLMAFF